MDNKLPQLSITTCYQDYTAAASAREDAVHPERRLYIFFGQNEDRP